MSWAEVGKGSVVGWAVEAENLGVGGLEELRPSWGLGGLVGGWAGGQEAAGAKQVSMQSTYVTHRQFCPVGCVGHACSGL